VLKRICFLILFSAAVPAMASDGYVSGKIGTWSFSTSGISASNESASGFGLYTLEAGYSLTPKFQVMSAFNVLLSDGLGGQTGFGVDLGVRYFPFTDAGTAVTQTDEAQVRVTEKWRPYIGVVFTERTFNFVLSTTFVGGGVRAGVDYQMGRNWYLNAEIRYDMLYGPDDGEASQNNILVGAGLEF
jgi:opacity protein-like surface antigen